MLTPYIPIFIIVGITAGLGILLLVFTFVIGPRKPSAVKESVYESGLVPIGPGRRRTSVRFYLTATLFILFDIEVIYLYPWAVSFRDLAQPAPDGIGMNVVWVMFTFLGILALGYIYIWKKGALEWGVSGYGETGRG